MNKAVNLNYHEVFYSRVAETARKACEEQKPGEPVTVNIYQVKASAMSFKDFGVMLGVTAGTVRGWADKHHHEGIQRIRIGGRVFIDMEIYERWCEKSRREETVKLLN